MYFKLLVKNEGKMTQECKTDSKLKTNRKKLFAVIITVIILIAPFFAAYVANRYVISKVNDALAAITNDCHYIYTSAKYNLWTNGLSVENFSIICLDEEVAKFDLINFKDVKFSDNIPQRMLAEFDHGVMNADVKIFGPFGEIASKMGFAAITNRGRISYSSSENATRLSFTVNAENIGVLVGDIETDYSELKNLDNLSVVNKIKANITFKDNGFVDAAMGRYAETLGIESSEEARARALNGLEKRIYKTKQNQSTGASQLEEVYRFMQNPNEINITVTAEDNLSLMDVYNSLDYTSWRNFANSAEFFKPKITAQ